jgi:hypothetical protein
MQHKAMQFNEIDKEAMISIFRNLSSKEIAASRQVCQLWMRLIDSQYFFFFKHLPAELQAEILSYLTLPERLQLRTVCKTWLELLQGDKELVACRMKHGYFNKASASLHNEIENIKFQTEITPVKAACTGGFFLAFFPLQFIVISLCCGLPFSLVVAFIMAAIGELQKLSETSQGEVLGIAMLTPATLITTIELAILLMKWLQKRSHKEVLEREKDVLISMKNYLYVEQKPKEELEKQPLLLLDLEAQKIDNSH